MIPLRFPRSSGRVLRVGALALLFMLAGSASAADALNIVFTCHSATTNSFWQAVKLGFDDACAKVGAKGQFIFVQTEGSSNSKSPICRQPLRVSRTH